MADLVTGDAVPLDLRVAGLPSRTLALALDVAIQVALLAVGLVLVSWVFSAGGSPGAQAALTLSVVVLALVGWPTLLETVTRGRSAGKLVMGLRVVRDDGGPVRLRHSLVRALAMVFLDLWVTSGVVGGLSALVSSRSKRMGDHLAGTIVVGERVPRTAGPGQVTILMPPPLATWAAGADLVAVPDLLALNVRTFLLRAPALDPASRATTATRLATELSAYVRPPAPPGTPAEAYLAAVLAERTRRSTAAGPAGGWSVPGPRPDPPGPPSGFALPR
ncbi:MAG TPA: RDD family protein [Candidatus Nanopelagicales bacterium]